MVTRKRKGGLIFRKKRKNRTIKTQNRANVRDLTYELATRDYKKPGSSGIVFSEYEKLRPKAQVPKYRKLAEEIIEKKANNSRTRRRERLALMKRKTKGGKRKKRKRKKTKKRRTKN